MSSSKITNDSEKKWLREASLRRLSLFVQDRTEMIGSAAKLGISIVTPSKLEKSGLNSYEKFHLEQWVAGSETGRQCMTAILHNRKKVKGVKTDSGFQPVELIREMIDLPENFLCDSGYLFETVFKRPPTSVVREALQLLVEKAREKSTTSLGEDQINIAIKQLRLENLGLKSFYTEDNDENEKEENNPADENKSPEKRAGTEEIKPTSDDESFRLQIMIELIRMHILSSNKKQCGFDFDAPLTDFFDDVNDMIPEDTPLETLFQHLKTPLPHIVKVAETMKAEDLESVNSTLKPYLQQLSSLKAELTTQLKELQDSRAYLSLGITSDATDEMVKKAYRLMAIRLHPDKPGGDTAKFQQLQDSYQEILKRRRSTAIERDAVDEARFKSKKQATKKSSEEEDDVDNDEIKSTKKRSEKSETVDDNVEKEKDLCNEEKNDELEAEMLKNLLKKKSKNNENNEENEIPETTENSTEDSSETLLNSNTPADLKKLNESVKPKVENPYQGFNLPKPNRRVQTEYESDEQHAKIVREDVDEMLRCVKQAASICTELAQRNIRWQKTIEKAANQPYPYAVKDILKLISPTAAAAVGTKGKNQSRLLLNVEACSLQQAVSPVEHLCEWAQLIAAKAMEIPGDCGEHYGSVAASVGSSFLVAIESTMQHSLNALKTVVSLIKTQEQLASSLTRVRESCSLAMTNEEIHSLMVEMVLTSVRSNVVTIRSTVDRVVDTALAAADVSDLVHKIMQQTEAKIITDARRKAANKEMEQQEEDYCEEDREALRKCRAERMEEQEQQRKAEQQRREKEKAEKKEEDGEGEDSAEKGLNDLKEKIRMLQVQLKVQHVQALQTMNSEVLTLQQQILQELKSIPFVTSVESLFTNEVNDKILAANVKIKKNSKNNGGKALDYRSSVLSLVAEFLDGACTSLRNDLTENDESNEWLLALAGKEAPDRSRRSLLHKHLSWVKIVLADGLSSNEVIESISEEFSLPEIPVQENGSNQVLDEENVKETGDKKVEVKLALLPDYRSKTLYLASLVDAGAVNSIIFDELKSRLREILTEDAQNIAAAKSKYQFLHSNHTLDLGIPSLLSGSGVNVKEIDLSSDDYDLEDEDYSINTKDEVYYADHGDFNGLYGDSQGSQEISEDELRNSQDSFDMLFGNDALGAQLRADYSKYQNGETFYTYCFSPEDHLPNPPDITMDSDSENAPTDPNVFPPFVPTSV